MRILGCFSGRIRLLLTQGLPTRKTTTSPDFGGGEFLIKPCGKQLSILKTTPQLMCATLGELFVLCLEELGFKIFGFTTYVISLPQEWFRQGKTSIRFKCF